jgi:hypothetical protein
MEKTKSSKELKSTEAGRVWEENKHLYLTRVVKGAIEHSTAYWLYGRPARLLATLYRTQYRNGFGHPEAEGRISVEKIREKAFMGLRSQKVHLDKFQNDGLLTWGLLKAGQRRHGKVARKTGIWFRLNLQSLRDRTGEAEKLRLQKEIKNVARTAKARAVKAERNASTIEVPSSVDAFEVTPMSLAGAFHRLMENYEQRKRAAVTLPTPSGGQVSVPKKLTPELTAMLLGKKKATSAKQTVRESNSSAQTGSQADYAQ